MTNRKLYIVFGLLSFCFSVFADKYAVCDTESCQLLKTAVNNEYFQLANGIGNARGNATSIDNQLLNIMNSAGSGTTVYNQAVAARSTLENLRTTIGSISSYAYSMNLLANNIDCYACTNGSSVCADLAIVTNIYNTLDMGVSQIAGGLTNIVSFLGRFSGDYGNDLSDSLDYLNNRVNVIRLTLSHLSSSFDDLLANFQGVIEYLIFEDDNELSFWRVHDPIILQELQNISSNLLSGSSADFSFTNRLYQSSLLGWDRFQSYLQAQNANQTVSWYPVSPYNSQQNLQNATIYDALAAGFENTLISLGSLNNYFYWIKNHMPSNSFDDVKILASLGALSNTLNRIDDYVVQDFSNEFYRLSQYLITNSFSSSSSSVDSNYYHSVTGSLLTILDLLDTNNLYLASIESSVTNIDFSVGRFRDYLLGSQNSIIDYDGSEDSSYYDFLTNKYIVGTSEDGVSSNWFERIETLLAALVFSTDSNTNIVSSGSFDGISENDVRGTLESVSFQTEFNDMAESVGSVQRSFTQILTSLHSSVKNVAKPQSISIGFTDNGASTTDFNALLDGDFEISVSVGEFGSFTEVVRAVTTMIIVLITLIMIYKTCFFLIRNAYRLYSFGRTLVTSIFFR